MLWRLFDGIVSFLKGAWRAITSTLRDLWENWQATVILVLASIGTGVVLQELPFVISVPVWLESWIVVPMVVPVVATALVAILAYFAMREET